MKELQAQTESHEQQEKRVRNTDNANGQSTSYEPATLNKELLFDFYLDKLEQANAKQLQSENVPDDKMKKFQLDFFDVLEKVK